MQSTHYNDNVFINCPFDSAYKKLFDAMVFAVRDWLRTASRRETIPSGGIIWERYQEFMEKLPQMAREGRLIVEELVFNDYTSMVTQWLRAKAGQLS